jgi:hypothetical protein
MNATSHGVPPKVEDGGNVRILTFAGGTRAIENMLARELDGHTDGLAGCHLLLDFTNVEALGSEELGTREQPLTESSRGNATASGAA